MARVRPVIVGWDAVSPLGLDWQDQWERALRGESGVGPLTRFALSDSFPVRIAGQVDTREIDPCPPFLRPREMVHWTSPIFRYGMLVVDRALSRAGISIGPELAPRVAVTFSTAIGGLDAVVDADRAMVASGSLPMPCVNPNSCVNMITGKISMLTGATGPAVTTIAACATGSASMAVGAMMIEAGMADVVIAGAVDFPLVEPIVAGFATMNGAYKPKAGAPAEPPERASRPFSADRRGFVISEGAGCILLAHPDFARSHGLRAAFELAGWAMSSDANHPVAPHRPTIARCIAEALGSAGIGPGAIQSVNAHATSTRIGDKTEADALHDVFGSSVPPVSANKSLFGHAMGASSVLESLLALEGMQHDTVLPTINYTPDPEVNLDGIAPESRRVTQEYVLKNAFGFGGMNTCVVFRRLS
jgi:3-oxoacyl-[acyl-carrier-protein] synthase II